MRLRSRPSRWFEIHVPREKMVHAVEILGTANAVELDPEPAYNASLDVDVVRRFLAEYAVWAGRYAGHLPETDYCPVELPGPPAEVVQRLRAQMRRWDAEAAPLLADIDVASRESERLQLVQEFLAAASAAGLDPALLADSGRLLEVAVCACPPEVAAAPASADALIVSAAGARHAFHVVVGTGAAFGGILEDLQQQNCRRMELPDRLDTDLQKNRLRIEAELRDIDHRLTQRHRELRALAERHDVLDMLGNAGLLRWYADNAPGSSNDARYCRVTGWTGEADPDLLTQLLARAGIDALVRFPAEPALVSAPTHVQHAAWIQPFEFFTRLLGTPARDEVDPTPLLAFIVPVLFGYMFPDVGHGLMLIALSLVAGRRWPALRFLLPCGLGAIGFGVLFGEFFGLHGIVPALWLSPFDAPLAVLVAPLFGGIILILLGLGLASLEAYWRGRLSVWLAVDAAVLVLYAAAVATYFWPGAAMLMVVAVIWYFAGTLYTHPANRWAALGLGVGRLLESIAQLAINTFSFVRVGAFALAHAGLSSAVVGMTEQIDSLPVTVFVLVAGNILVVALEGLIVFVQTTRLVLFEFFIRFLRAEGRAYRPLRPVAPASIRTPGRS